MVFAGLNILAILVAAFAGFGVGAVWYTVLSRPWMAGNGITGEDMQRRAAAGRPWLPFAISFLSLVVMSWVLAGIVGHLGPGQVTVRNAVISGGFVWAGFIVTTTATGHVFTGKPMKLILIDAGHWLAVLMVMGAVIGAFGV